MKKDAKAAKKELETAGKKHLADVKDTVATAYKGTVQAKLDEIKKSAEDKMKSIKDGMGWRKKPQDSGKPADKETKIDDKPKPAQKLMLEWPGVLSPLVSEGELAEEQTSSLQQLLSSVFDGLFVQ